MNLLCKVSLLLVVGLNVFQVQAQNCGVSRRRPWRSLSCGEQQAYLDAVQQLKSSGIYDEITRVHQQSGNDNHFVPTFLPFHRWLIYVFERELQRVSGSCITVPYWDWENGSRTQTLAPVLQPQSFGTNNGGGCVSNGIARDWRVAENGGCLIRRFVQRIGFIRDVEILNRITNLGSFGAFWPNFEAAPHTSVHDYIGGPMEGFWAPDDPLFHLHHSNVDRIYALWQNYYNHDAVPVGQLGRQHYSAQLDTPLRIRQGPRVDFNAPGTNRPPTPRELLQIRGGIMDVIYEGCNLALTLSQTSGRFQNNPGWHVPGNPPNAGCGAGGGGGGQPPQQGPPPQQQPVSGAEGGMGGPPPTTCQRIGQRCNRNSHCCSGRCRRSTGRCRRRRTGEFRRERRTSEVEVHLSSPYLEGRWSELMSEFYPDQPDRIFETLGREDCEQRAMQGINNTAIDMPTPIDVVQYHATQTEAMHVNVTGNLTNMFDCHYVIQH